MAKRKNMTADQVSDFMDKAGDLAEVARDIKESVNDCAIEDVRNPYQHAKMLLAVAEDITAAARALLTQHDMQVQRAEMAAIRAKKSA